MRVLKVVGQAIALTALLISDLHAFPNCSELLFRLGGSWDLASLPVRGRIEHIEMVGDDSGETYSIKTSVVPENDQEYEIHFAFRSQTAVPFVKARSAEELAKQLLQSKRLPGVELKVFKGGDKRWGSNRPHDFAVNFKPRLDDEGHAIDINLLGPVLKTFERGMSAGDEFGINVFDLDTAEQLNEIIRSEVEILRAKERGDLKWLADPLNLTAVQVVSIPTPEVGLQTIFDTQPRAGLLTLMKDEDRFKSVSVMMGVGPDYVVAERFFTNHPFYESEEAMRIASESPIGTLLAGSSLRIKAVKAIAWYRLIPHEDQSEPKDSMSLDEKIASLDLLESAIESPGQQIREIFEKIWFPVFGGVKNKHVFTIEYELVIEKR